MKNRPISISFDCLSQRIVLFVCVWLTGAALADARGQTPASAPASAPAASRLAGAAADVLTSGDASVDAILDRLEVKGKAIEDLSAKVTQERIEDGIPLPETTIDKGELFFRRLKPNPRFLIRFDEVIAGGVRKTDRNWYAFDGEWLTEVHEKTRTVSKKQMVREGEHIDVFKLGAGPIPLPFGQSRRDMLSNFRIVKGSTTTDDPPNTDHLVCEPTRGSSVEADFRVVHFFVDRKLDLPTRIVAERRKDMATIRVTFENVAINTGLAASRFELKPPGDYSSTTEPLPPLGRGPNRP